MTPSLASALALAISVAGLALLAASRADGGAAIGAWHMAAAAAAAAVMAVAAIVDLVRARAAAAPPSAIASLSARHMGLIWAWAALAMLATYGTGIQSWKEWRTFTLAAAAGAGLALFLAAQLAGDRRRGTDDPTLLMLARYGSIIQLVGMLIAMAGLLLDGKMRRFLDIQRDGWQDWAANAIFFFGALALAVVGAVSLRTMPADSPKSS